MRSENEARLKKIRRISGILRVVCKVFFVPPVVVTAMTLWALATEWGSHYHGFQTVSVALDNYSFVIRDLSLRSRLVVGGYFTLRWGAMFLVVYYVHRLLGNYSRGEIFSADSVNRIRQWGFACVLWGAVKFVGVFVPGAVLPHSAPATKGHIQTYGSDVKVQPGDLIINGMPVQAHGGDLMMNGLIIIAISWFAAMAVEMREENELTV